MARGASALIDKEVASRGDVLSAELEALQQGLKAALELLAPQGRLVVISFHSLEDRIVKQFIARHAKAPAGNRRRPDVPDFTASLKDIVGAVKAGPEELRENPRARSAVLIVAEKITPLVIGSVA